jgi:myo-inositol catabolism protein IolS
MLKKRLGSSNLYLSALGMGCWAFGGGKYWGDQSQKDVDEVVHKALDQGINYFDTAEAYNDGESEASLGLALKGRRKEALIWTKVSTSNTKSAALREHCEASLKRLGTDYIDLYMLHWPINPKAIEHFTNDKELIASPPSVEEAFETLIDLQKEGKILEIGISNHGVKQMKEIKKTGARVIANELPYNLISRGIEDGILPYCIKNGIGIIGYMAMQQGILTGIYSSVESIPAAQAHSRHFHFSRGGEQSRHEETGAEAEIFQMLSYMQKISKEINASIPSLSLAWAMAKDGISCTLVGSRNVNELKMNIDTASKELSGDVIEELDKLSDPVLKKIGSSIDYYESRENSRIY